MPFRFTRRNGIAPFPNGMDGVRRTTTTIVSTNTRMNAWLFIILWEIAESSAAASATITTTHFFAEEKLLSNVSHSCWRASRAVSRIERLSMPSQWNFNVCPVYQWKSTRYECVMHSKCERNWSSFTEIFLWPYYCAYIIFIYLIFD